MIAQYSIPQTDYYKEGTIDVQNYALGGFWRSLSNPAMQHKNGNTWASWYKANTYANQAGFTVQLGNKPTAFTVGNGTDPSGEPSNHPTPCAPIFSDSGYVYLIQNEYHVDRFLVWKSTTPYGYDFELVGYFGTNESYLDLVYQNDTNCVFQTRNGASPDYDQSIIEVDLDDPSSYTETILTDGNYGVTNVRHYPCGGWHYNHDETDYVVVGINKRKDGDIHFYCTQLLIAEKTNLDIWYNIDLTYSKSISLDGVITNTELDDEYNVIGDPSDNTIDITEARMIKKGDDVYLCYLSDDSTNTYTVKKFTIGTGLAATLELPISDIYDDSTYLDNMTAMYSNGYNIVMRVKRESDVTSLYKLDYDCTTLTYIQDVSTPDGMYLGLPMNFDEIPKNQRYMMIGRSNPLESGEVPYIITNRKFR